MYRRETIKTDWISLAVPWNSDKGQLCIKVTLMVFRENCSLSLRTQTLWGKEENLNSPHPHECNRFYPVKLNTKTWSKISPAQYLGHLCEAAWESSSLWFVCAASLTGHTSPPTLRLHKVSADNLPEAAVKCIPVVVTWDYSPSHTLPALCSWMTSHQQPVFLHWDRAGGSESVRGNLWCLTFYLPLLFLYEVLFTVMTPWSKSPL